MKDQWLGGWGHHTQYNGMIPCPVSRPEPSLRPRTNRLKEMLGPQEEGICNSTVNVYGIIVILTVLLPKEPTAIYSGNHTWRNKEYSDISGTLWYRVWVDNDTLESEASWWTSLLEWVINEALTQGWLTMGSYPISKHVCGSWYRSHFGSLACGINVKVGKVKWKPLKLPTPP